MPSDLTCTDDELLRAWSGEGCQQSFQALVGKYFGLVHGLALRRTGNASLADEIAQSVFTRLAVRAGSIAARPTLAPWLHHCAWCETASALRRESTRRRHMNDYADHLRASQEGRPAAALQEALPHLDEALRFLPAEDQRIVLMRFYEGRGLRDIAAAMGKTEAAVRKQGQRALEKLALRLKHCGPALSAATLAAGLGAVLSPPASAATVALVATTATAAAGVKLTFFNHLLILMNTKTKIVAIAAACIAVPLAWQWHRTSDTPGRLAGGEKDTPAGTGDWKSADSRNDLPTRRNLRAAKAPGAGKVISGIAAEWKAALENPDREARSAQLAALLASLDAGSAPGVAEVIMEMEVGGHPYLGERRQFLDAWGRVDGRAALAYLSDEEGYSFEDMMAVITGFSRNSPEEARAWLEAHPGDEERNYAYAIVEGWAAKDLDAASAYAASLPPRGMDRFTTLLFERAMASGGVPEAERWFSQVPGDGGSAAFKQRAFDEVIKAKSRLDPAAAADWVAGMGRQSYMSGDGIPEIAAHLAVSSPQGAIRLLETLGMGEGEAVAKTSESYGRVIETWSKSDPAVASEWLRNHASHPAYDGMAAALAGTVAAADGAGAIAWANSIRDPDARSQARDQAAKAMLEAKGDAAMPTLQAAGYSKEQIGVLRKTEE